MSKKTKKINIFKFIARMVAIVAILIVIYIGYNMFTKMTEQQAIFDEVEETTASVTEYIVYGTHLNIKGNLNIDSSNISEVKLCLKTVGKEDEKIDIYYKKTSNGIEFSTSELINEGIDLEKLLIDRYYVFVEVQYNNEISKYYSLENTTDYNNVEYYTITKDNNNNKIDIKFGTYENLEYMHIDVNNTQLPNNVYDIVIDPGHRRCRYRG